MLQIKNCLSIWRTTGLGIVEPSLAILKLWHRSPSSSYPAPCGAKRRENKTGEDVNTAASRRIKRTMKISWWQAGLRDQSLRPKAKTKYFLPSTEEMQKYTKRHESAPVTRQLQTATQSTGHEDKAMGFFCFFFSF